MKLFALDWSASVSLAMSAQREAKRASGTLALQSSAALLATALQISM
jgi:hypothetical protein